MWKEDGLVSKKKRSKRKRKRTETADAATSKTHDRYTGMHTCIRGGREGSYVLALAPSTLSLQRTPAKRSLHVRRCREACPLVAGKTSRKEKKEEDHNGSQRARSRTSTRGSNHGNGSSSSSRKNERILLHVRAGLFGLHVNSTGCKFVTPSRNRGVVVDTYGLHST